MLYDILIGYVIFMWCCTSLRKVISVV